MTHGGTVNPPCNRKGRDGNPPPTGARASALPDKIVGLKGDALNLNTDANSFDPNDHTTWEIGKAARDKS